MAKNDIKEKFEARLLRWFEDDVTEPVRRTDIAQRWARVPADIRNHALKRLVKRGLVDEFPDTGGRNWRVPTSLFALAHDAAAIKAAEG